MADGKILLGKVDIDFGTAEAEATKLTQTINGLKTANSELAKQAKLAGGLTAEQAKEMNANKVAIANASSQLKVYNTTIAQEVALKKQEGEETSKVNSLLNQEVKTIAQAESANKQLNTAKKQLNLQTESGRKQLELINQKTDENNKFIKENSNQLEQQKIGIGNYEQAITSALQKIPLVGNALSKVASNAIAMSTGMKASATATATSSNALKIFRTALISTGIGAIVVAIGLLIAGFSRMTETMEPLNAILKGLGAVLDVILDRAVATGKALTNFATSFVKFITGDFKGAVENAKQGVEELKDAYTGIGEEIASEFEQARLLELANNETQRETLLLKARESEINKDLIELRQTMNDTSLTGLERQEAYNKASELINEKEQKRIALNQKNLALALEQINTQTKELELSEQATKFIEDLTAGRLDANEAMKQAQEITLSDANANESLKTAVDAVIKSNQDLATVEQNRLTLTRTANSIATQVATERKKAETEEAEAKAKAIEDDKKAKKKALELKEQEIEENLALEEYNLSRTNELTAEGLAKYQEVMKLKKDLLANQLEQERISQAEHNLELQKLTDESADYQIERTNELLQMQKDARLDDLKAQQEEIEIKNQYDFEAQQAKAEQERDFKLEQAEILIEDETELKERQQEINEEFADAEVAIEKAKTQAKLSLAQSVLGALKEFAGENTAISKAVGVAEIGINTAVAVTKALAELGPIAGAISAATIIATGAAQAAAVVATEEPSFEKGGVFEIGGKRHSQGGTKFKGSDGSSFEAEQGEVLAIVKRGSPELSALQAVNMALGGNSYGAKTNGYLESGGVIETNYTASIQRVEKQSDIRVINVASDTVTTYSNNVVKNTSTGAF